MICRNCNIEKSKDDYYYGSRNCKKCANKLRAARYVKVGDKWNRLDFDQQLKFKKMITDKIARKLVKAEFKISDYLFVKWRGNLIFNKY